jgi:ComF family protein
MTGEAKARKKPSRLLEFGREVLDVLLPPSCVLCDQPADARFHRRLCEACGLAWTPLAEGCRICGQPEVSPGTLCTRCQLDSPAFDRARSLALYEGPVKAGVRALKFDGQEGLAALFADFLAAAHPVLLPGSTPDYVVPVPLHWRRRFARGYNQAELLAIPLAKRLDRPMVPLLKRGRATRQQATLDSQARKANLTEVFELTRPAEEIQDRHLLIVDDVLTTGATASACARCFREAGARQIDVLTLARTP